MAGAVGFEPTSEGVTPLSGVKDRRLNRLTIPQYSSFKTLFKSFAEDVL